MVNIRIDVAFCGKQIKENGYFYANLYAYEGSEILRHTYYYVSDNGKTVELDWEETERGWRLGSESNHLSESHPFAEMN